MKKDLLKLLDLSREDILTILDTGRPAQSTNQKHGMPHPYPGRAKPWP